MTIPLFPTLPGQGWSVLKAPRFATRVQVGTSGRELRVLDQALPIWEFTLTFNYLRDPWDIRAGAGRGRGLGQDQLRTLMGFYLTCQGGFLPFHYHDPTDYTVAAQLIGVGDGSTTTFQLVRQLMTDGFVEPIIAPASVTHVSVNGVDSGGWAVDFDTGVVTMPSPPAAAAVVTWDGAFYFRCRFSDDQAEFENFVYQLWTVKTLKFRSILL